MRHSLILLLLAGVTLVVGADKKKAVTNEAGNENVDITANPLIDPEQINSAVGAEMPKGIIAIEVKIVPKGDYKLSLNRDDFILLSRKDGQRSGPYAPSQIAGTATMVVKTQSTGGGGGLGRSRTGPSWGGIPGTGGRPRQMDDPNSTGGIGNVAGHETKTTAEVKDEGPQAASPLLKALEEKIMPDKETGDPVSGLLYFPLDGKVKTKDLELIYKGPAGRLYVDFR